MECLQGAFNEPHDKDTALALSLGHFKKIVQLLDLGKLENVCNEYCTLLIYFDLAHYSNIILLVDRSFHYVFQLLQLCLIFTKDELL
jgi:hypothetical protein